MKFIILFCVVFAAVYFIAYFIAGKRILGRGFSIFINAIVVLVSPWFFLSHFDVGVGNDCCSDSAVFSPDHRLSMYFWVIFVVHSI